ncbi:MAG: MCE family protein [Myxococcaceae bacterium]|nr:MCE family protein [Myxococcaceae bacterium]
MDERRLEIRVGLLMLLGIAGVLGLLWLMGELTLSRAPSLKVLFAHTGNVVKGAPVKLGGVTVGRVDAITLDPTRRDERGEPLPVLMSLSVDEATLAALHSDAAVTIATVGPLGEPYLELWVGSADAPPLPRDATLRGTDFPRLDVVALRLSRFLESASRILDENPKAMSTLVSGVSRLTTNVDAVLTENRDDLRTLTAELTAAAKDLRQLAQVARRSFEPGGKGDRLLDDAAVGARALRTDVPELSENAKRVLAHLNALSDQFSEEDMRKLRRAIDRYTAAAEKLDSLAARGDRLLGQIERGEGTLGKIQQDPALYGEVKALVEDLRKHPWKILWKD